MSNWRSKAIVQKTISLFPFSHRLNYFFQKRITKSVVLQDQFLNEILDQASQSMHLYKNYSRESLSLERIRVLEVGTGWYPILSICYFLCGANDIVTIDIRDHLRTENLRVLIESMKRYHATGALQKRLPQLNLERWDVFSKLMIDASVDEFLSRLRIKRVITKTNKLTKESFDLCISVNVAQHVSEKQTPNFFLNLYALTKRGGHHYHFMGCYDHFCHYDNHTSKFNYLKFSKGTWRIINNRLQPQNRLRVNYYSRLFKEIGFTLVRELHSDPNYSELNLVSRISGEFNKTPREILAIDYGVFFLAKN